MLTDLKCRTAKTKNRPYRLADGGGLSLEIRPSGLKHWRYRFKLGGKENIYAMGEYVAAPAGETPEEAKARQAGGSFTLAEAREERARARALVRQGISPTQHRQLERSRRKHEHATTYKAIAAEWLAMREWEEITRTKRERMLERLVYPKIGDLPVKAITPAQVLGLLTAIAKKNGPSVAQEAKRTMSGVFELAVCTLRADSDPVYPVRKMLPSKRTQHKRPLSPDDIGRLLREVQEHGGRQESVAAFHLMWWTLCRPSEACGARWSEFDLDAAIWTIPAERMKKRREHTVPLPRQAVTMLRALQNVTGRWEHVFPGRDDRRAPMVSATFRQMMRSLGWAGRFSPHAARTTGSTRLHELGYPSDWIERQLAHVEQNSVKRSYNHAEHMVPRTRMMQRWADLLEAWTDGNDEKVVPIQYESHSHVIAM